MGPQVSKIRMAPRRTRSSAPSTSILISLGMRGVPARKSSRVTELQIIVFRLSAEFWETADGGQLNDCWATQAMEIAPEESDIAVVCKSTFVALFRRMFSCRARKFSGTGSKDTTLPE